MTPRARIILMVLMLALVAGGIWRYAAARRGAAVTGIPGNGIIEATEIEVSSKVAGRILTLSA
ncbi:MAG TPA: secretion protein HlyD, partial [Armatimonadota bacterium]|nr:secretion protein HlyD [Armatimonadota bacterium]